MILTDKSELGDFRRSFLFCILKVEVGEVGGKWYVLYGINQTTRKNCLRLASLYFATLKGTIMRGALNTFSASSQYFELASTC
jgi:hypothetical protein